MAMDLDPKPQPYTFDLGAMLCTDPNPLPTHTPATLEATLTATAQSCAQALINQLLTTCPISRAESDGAVQITLPPITTPLPREKHVPKEKEKTKWEKFAEKKGIKAKRKDGKLVFDEARGEWKPKYGFKSKKAEGVVGEDWLVEVDEKAEKGQKEEGRKGRKTGEGDVARRDRKLQARKGK